MFSPAKSKLHFTAVLFCLTASLGIAAPSQDYFEQAGKAFKEKDYHTAIYYYRKSLTENPNFLPAKRKLAWSYYYNAAYTQAETLFGELLKAKPSDLDYILGMSKVLTAEGQFRDAINLLKKARAIDPYNLDINFQHAAILYSIGKRDMAYTRTQNILRTHPRHLDSVRLMAMMQLDRELYGKSLANVNKAIEIAPNDYGSYILKGVYFRKRFIQAESAENKARFLEQALLAMETAHSYNEKVWETNYWLGYLYYLREDWISSYTHFEKAYSQNPKNRSVLGFRAQILGRLAVKAGPNTAANPNPWLKRSVLAYKELLANYGEDDLGRMEFDELLLSTIPQDSNPDRIDEARYYLREARLSRQDNLAELGFQQLRESLRVYPNLISARIELLNAYQDERENLNAYVNGLEALRRAFPENRKYLSALDWALRKRRQALYYKAGLEKGGRFNFPRSARRIFVFHFQSKDDFPSHPLGGKLIGQKLNDIINTYGRIQGYNGVEYENALNQLERAGGTRWNHADYGIFTPAKIKEVLRYLPSDRRPEYLLYGNYKENPNGSAIEIEYKLYDLEAGVIRRSFTQKTSGRFKVLRSHIRAVRRIFRNIPYRGRLVKVDRDGRLFFNLGRIDGVKEGSLFRGTGNEGNPIFFRVAETSTYISRIEATDPEGKPEPISLRKIPTRLVLYPLPPDWTEK